jgi:hypothetical protein
METVRVVLTWINWVLLLVLGIYNCYLQFDESDFHENKLQKVLSIYVAVFGFIGVLHEARVKAIYNNIAFLQSKSGRGVFFIFVGTICIAFAAGASGALGQAAAWVLGAFSCFVGLWQFLTLCCFNEPDDDEDVEGEDQPETQAGPSAI